VSRKTRPQPRARAAVVHLPRRKAVAAGRFLPSSRSVAIGVIVAGLAAGAYGAARETSVFAVHTVRVEGVPPALARRVQRALVPLEGVSLLKIKPGDVARLATALPTVAAVSYDRAFPNTLRIRVQPEEPVAVVRRGIEAWLVSRRGRVIKRVEQGTHDSLPRIWLSHAADVSLGATLGTGGGAEEVSLLVPLRDAGLDGKVTMVHVASGQIAYKLRNGVELRVGRPDELPLKLAIAARILATTPVAGYLDVSVPERPVAGTDTQVSG
jgi:cell division septal protein FtsQ